MTVHRFDLQESPPLAPRRRTSTFWRGVTSGALMFVVLAAFGVGIALIGYALIASDLPAPGDLSNRASSFQSTRIYDREGNLLNETFDPNTGRRTVVQLACVPEALQQATIATEDANFYRHAGIDPVALIRALYYAVQEGDVVSGGSTIPQQLVKMVFLSPERTIRRKVNEAILSAEISRRYAKEQILEIYLNELYYGNFAYGADAAAETYFAKDISELTLGESALLAGLPQLPAVYDPYTQPDRAKRRQSIVLGLMVEDGSITQEQADAAWLQPLQYSPLAFNLESPHFTLFVRQELERILGPEALYQTGLEVTTTLDPWLQSQAEIIVKAQVAALADRNVSNGALVAMRPATGEVLALVGSADFDNVEIDGQVNMALAPRQPGSSIKPFVYLATFEHRERSLEERWTPGTLIADIKEAFPDGVNPDYVPTNYDGREHGLMTVRDALANSYNIPAVRGLEMVGTPYFLTLAKRLGITTLTRADYGLSLSLGSGEIPLIELTGAYAVLANNGVHLPPAVIREIRDSAGNTICSLESERPCQPGAIAQQVVDPADAFLITDILRDNAARTPTFGANSVLRLERPAAVKTGTTNDIRDVLTVGYTPQLVTGVWVGNADNTPMRNVAGSSGAGPIWNRFMAAALANDAVEDFAPVPGVRLYTVCADTGTEPSDACPQTEQAFFRAEQPPLGAEQDLWQRLRLDRTTGKLATEFTPAQAVEERVFKVYPEPYAAWASEHGIAQPPRDASDTFTFEPELNIRRPVEGAVVSGIVNVEGTANVPAFRTYELQYGVSHNPGAYSPPISGPHGNPVFDSTLGQWDVRGLGNGPHSLRLVVRDQVGTEYVQRVRIFVENAAPTEPPAATATWTAEPTVSAADLATATPIATAVPPETTEPPTPEATATVAPTVVPTAEPVAEPDATESVATPSVPTGEPTVAPTVAPTVVPPAEPITGTDPITVTGGIADGEIGETVTITVTGLSTEAVVSTGQITATEVITEP